MNTVLYAKLRGRIVEVYGSQAKFADVLGVSQQIITAKLNGSSQFTQQNIISWANALGIDADNIGAYFFADKLSIS